MGAEPCPESQEKEVVGPRKDPVDSSLPDPCLVCCTNALSPHLHQEATTLSVLVTQCMIDRELSSW